MTQIIKALDRDELKQFILDLDKTTKIYLGADSERQFIDNKKVVDYFVVVVVHVNGNNGAKVFGEVIREQDYDREQNRPKQRLMQEVYLVASLYLELAELLEDFETEIHLDINQDIKFGSSCVLDQAIGYIKGVTGLNPKLKPNAFAASSVADRAKKLVLPQISP